MTRTATTSKRFSTARNPTPSCAARRSVCRATLPTFGRWHPDRPRCLPRPTGSVKAWLTLIAAVRELLRDSFTRLIEHVDDAHRRADRRGVVLPSDCQANSIAWLVWHSARVQDAQLCDIAGIEQVWTRDGWVDRFGLDLPRDSHGYGHSPEEVGKVRASAELLAGYYHAVHAVTLEYIASVTPDELAASSTGGGHPPVTASARLVSIIDDCAQHLGQAAYVRGIVR